MFGMSVLVVSTVSEVATVGGSFVATSVDTVDTFVDVFVPVIPSTVVSVLFGASVLLVVSEVATVGGSSVDTFVPVIPSTVVSVIADVSVLTGGGLLSSSFTPLNASAYDENLFVYIIIY
ncbi:MAG: hypothetical protein LBN42_04525, partial [Oscillospiraceae bacterium]|nr:hypothetical protein [Oscillospiraceae bacterium]